MTGQQRTTQNHARRVLAPEEALRARLREIAQEWPRYGFRRAKGLLRNEGWLVNRKRVQRLWREEGLRVPASVMKRRRLGTSTVPVACQQSDPITRGRSTSSSTPPPTGAHQGALDVRRVHPREPGPAPRSLDHCRRRDHALDDARLVRGTPDYIRMDNGPEFVALAIRDWCRAHGTGTAYIEPGSPWPNPYVESFNGKLRDELFSREVFDTIMEARLLFDDWCDTYNRHRPHSALGYLPPAAFAAAFNQPELS